MGKLMQVDLSGKSAIVTGGGGVIGKAIAKALARNGAYVVITGRSLGPLEAVKNEIDEFGGECTIIQCDVSDKSSIQSLVDKTLEKYNKIDILVNNAGVNGGPEERKKFWEYNDDLWEKIVKTDFSSVYYLSKPVAKHMIAQGSGSIINIASVTGMVPLRNQCAYAAVKAGVAHLTKVMAIELGGTGVRANAVSPGSVLTGQLKEIFYNNPKTSEGMLSHIPMHRTGEPEEIAAMVSFLASDDASYVTGTVTPVDGGWICGYNRDF